jgi:hypothetical protein
MREVLKQLGGNRYKVPHMRKAVLYGKRFLLGNGNIGTWSLLIAHGGGQIGFVVFHGEEREASAKERKRT